MRQFWLPDNVNVDGISTKLESDVLTVNAPKIKPEAVSNSEFVGKSTVLMTSCRRRFGSIAGSIIRTKKSEKNSKRRAFIK
jgi:hypothetical protein